LFVGNLLDSQFSVDMSGDKFQCGLDFRRFKSRGFVGLQASENNIFGIDIMDAVHRFLLGALTLLTVYGELMNFHVGFATKI
jgi:hypothetical protein